MFKQNKIDLHHIFFFIFIMFSLFEGYFCKFSEHRTAVDNSICQKYFLNYWEENGFIENLQVLFVLIAIILIFKIAINSKIKFIKLFLIFKTLALIYYLGEEISWGQHFIKFNTPEIFTKLNHQNEVNLHNISNLFDQLPRTLVFIWCSLTIFIFKFLEKIKKINFSFQYLFVPNKNLIYVSILLLSISAPDLIIDKFNLHPGHYDEINKIYISEAKYYDLVSLNYIRFSELQELIFSFYFLSYAIFLNKIKKIFI